MAADRSRSISEGRDDQDSRAASYLSSPLILSLIGGALFWCALPPLGWWPLGWIAPVFWLWLVQCPQLGGRHPYRAVWGASVVFWIVVMQGVRLAHWANYLGLVALGLYLGIYLPIFVAVARVAVHRWRLPLILAAPVMWAGVELARGYGPLGFSMALLAQTQVSQGAIIQISDLFGAYGVSFVMMVVAAGITTMLPSRQRGWKVWPALPIAIVMASVLAYGHYRLHQPLPDPNVSPPVRVALIQGSIDTVFEDNPDRPREIFEQYSELTEKAYQQYRPLDLVVWPETMFPVNDVLMDEHVQPQLDATIDPQMIEDNAVAFQRLIDNGIRRLNEPNREVDADRRATNWMLGTTTWEFGDHPPRRYNAAIMVNSQAQITGRYFKMHPVIFGEYVPFGELIPALYRLFPLPNGLTPGTEPVSLAVSHLRFSPSICFESIMPHLIRWQVAHLTLQGQSPDVLVNLTNDGWFWGSSILDMQLDCAVFRAVELRRPVLVAANTGFSAWIDGNGQILAKGPRRATGTLLATVQRDGRTSLYERWGDVPLSLCALGALVAAIWGIGSGIRSRRRLQS